MMQQTDHGPQLATIQSAATYRRIATAFLLLTAAVVGLAAYVIFSRAHVVILSKQEEVKSDFFVDVARGAGDSEVTGDVFELSDSASATFPSSSVVAVDQPATGTVSIKSKLYRAQTLVATTRLLTADGRLYRIKNTVVVPSNGSVEAEAFSTDAGAKGEAPIGTTFTIPGLNADSQKFFTVTATEAFVGGKTDVRMVTQQDVDKAAEVLAGKLNDGLASKMRDAAKQALPAGRATWTGELIVPAETARTLSVPVGTVAPEFTLTIQEKATGVFYDQDAFDATVKANLSAKLLDGRELQSVAADSVTKTIEKRDLVAGRANVHVTASGMSVMSANAPALDRSKLTGVTVAAATAYLESIDGVASASIKATPFWVGRMPGSAEHISIEVR